jgi:hypothetical protein
MSSSRFLATLVVAFGALTVHDSQAQRTPSSAAAPSGIRDPGDPKAAVPPATYTSAFGRYRPNAEVDVGPWRDLNENVGRIGGWRVYGREASPDAGVSPASKPGHGQKH